MSHVEDSLLGKKAVFTDRYDPTQLFPIARSESRKRLGIKQKELPFVGEDVWTSFEVSWLERSGKPCVALGYFHIPCDSSHIIESKSFKLYLNSFNQEMFDSKQIVQSLMQTDLSAAAGKPVTVNLVALNQAEFKMTNPDEAAVCIDQLDAENFEYSPNASLLELDENSHGLVEETLYSDLLRSNCPVTDQPDWATVYIAYRGMKISHESLLRYIVSFRLCQDFHEQCVEQIFTDIMAICECESLAVFARYTRRGGLDINPYRATPDCAAQIPSMRFIRQ